MKLIKQNIRLLSILLGVLILSLIAYGAYSITSFGSRWFSSSANTYLRRAKNNVTAGIIYDRNNVPLAATSTADKSRHYHPDEKTRRSLVHVVGDSLNNVAYGAESFFANYLYAFNESYLERLAQAFQGKPRLGNNIRLSVDSGLSRKALELFPQGKAGAIIAMNYRTGELLALESFPNFDPMDLSKNAENDPLQPYWNRATKWVSAPGSTFKLVTLAAAQAHLPEGIHSTYTCNGALPVGDVTITDAGNATHGTIDLEKALEVSCNVVFAQVALELGDQKLKQTAASFGIGDYFLFSDLVVENSVYPQTNRTEREIAWTGPGQSSLQITPMHMTMITAAIANDGMMMEPRLLLNARTAAGDSRYSFFAKEYKRAMPTEAAETLAEAMRGVVTSGTGRSASVQGLRICGKTGSSQVDGQEEANAWFVGFIDDPAYPFAVCVVVEDAGGGSSVAAPIARELIQHLTGK